MNDLTLRDQFNRRKYLTQKERKAFKRHAKRLSSPGREFCLLLYYTGCRPSEALLTNMTSLDMEQNIVVIRTLKQKGETPAIKKRELPLPGRFMKQLFKLCDDAKPESCLFHFSRTTAWRIVKEVMETAGIAGIHATCKGLRHAFAIACLLKKIPLTQIQRWLGHAKLETTAIYIEACGAEARNYARRIW